MTKYQIKKIKLEAKKRNNRRMSDGEAVRVMAQYSAMMGMDCVDELPIVDLNSIDAPRVMREHYYDRDGNIVHKPRIGEDGKPFKQKVNNLSKCIKPNVFAPKIVEYTRTNKSNRRLTKRQYLSLMKKAAKELGINNDKTYPILDLDAPENFNSIEVKEDPASTEQIINKIIDSFGRLGLSALIKRYEEIVRKGRLTLADKLNVLSYLYYGAKGRNIPMVLIPQKDRIKSARQVCKKWGDIKVHAKRYMPDEEFIRETNREKRTKKDNFDRLSEDRKVEWARHANTIIGFGGNSRHDNFMNGVEFKIRTEEDVSMATFAMKYACKMSKIPEFKDIFASPFWILYRISKYFNTLTSEEFNIWSNIAFDELGINRKAYLSIINGKEALNKIEPTLKGMKLYNDFKKACSDGTRKNKIRIANELITRSVKNENR